MTAARRFHYERRSSFRSQRFFDSENRRINSAMNRNNVPVVSGILLDVSVPKSRRPSFGPDQRKPLTSGDLLQRHLRSNRVAKPEIKVMLAPRRSRGCEIQPFVGEDDVLRDGVAFVVV